MSGKKEWFEERKRKEGKRKEKQKRKSWILEPHKAPHTDEFVGMWMLKRFGEQKFPGISNAPVIFGDSGVREGLSFESSNVIPIGIGGGLFDEHRNNRDTDRIPGECAATLTAKELGIQEMPELKKLLEYVLKHDSTGKRMDFDLADVVISLNRKYGKTDPKKVINDVFDILDALYEIKEEPVQKDREALAQIIEAWIRKSRIPAEVTKPMRKFAVRLKNGHHFDFDLTTIFTALTQKFGIETAKEKVEMFLEAKQERQTSFLLALKEIDDPKITKIIVVKRRTNEKIYSFTVVVGKSENPDFGKAARKKTNAAIVIQRKSSGRTLIFGNNKVPIKQEMSNLVAMIRLEEMLQRGRMPIVDYRKMSSAGALKEVPNWYFLRGKDSVGQILNGSDNTAPDIEPTAIPLETIVHFATMALKLGDTFSWKTHLENAFRRRIHSRT